jgi:hypothetical protein
MIDTYQGTIEQAKKRTQDKQTKRQSNNDSCRHRIH